MDITSLKLGITRCHVIKERGAVMVDAGFTRSQRLLKRALNRLSFAPTEIKLIIGRDEIEKFLSPELRCGSGQ